MKKKSRRRVVRGESERFIVNELTSDFTWGCDRREYPNFSENGAMVSESMI